MKVSQLCGPALDWAVARAMGFEINLETSRTLPFAVVSPDYFHNFSENYFFPSSQWDDGGPIIDREGITLGPWDTSPAMAHMPGPITSKNPRFVGPTVLTAAMRCFVASKLGKEIEIPEKFK